MVKTYLLILAVLESRLAVSLVAPAVDIPLPTLAKAKRALLLV